MSPPKTPDVGEPKHPLEEHHRHVVHLALVLTACIVGVFMFLFTVSTLIRYFYSRRYNRRPNGTRDTPILFDLNGDSPTANNDDDVAADQDDDLAPVHHVWYIRTAGLQQSLIDSITVFKYRKNEGIIDSSECSVCLGEFQHDETLRLLPKCSHAFHVPCIDTWLRSHKNCPLCRAPVVHDETGAVDQNVQIGSHVSVSDHQNQNREVPAEDSDDGAGLEDGGGSGESSGGTETQPLRRSVSMDVSSASNSMLRDVGVDIDTPYGEKVSSSKIHMSITEKHGSSSSSSSSSSTTIHKLASFGRALQKGPVSMRRSFSHNRKFLFSTHYRSQSSTLPL
ncbi:E3 ubiquitin-protein ligase RING1-like [Vigna unguiculata]|uniref:E3 ubiquitin-protein ligase RING1-like n=1 Tax=Vigna unguiculata TaxID=3917 RepID=UPI0010171162|nr:E3 ubiquitin-protein ligase RING1-like [Vigna unguiculata]